VRRAAGGVRHVDVDHEVDVRGDGFLMPAFVAELLAQGEGDLFVIRTGSTRDG
jgi:hypothetical protein